MKNVLKIWGFAAAAEILTLFIDVTLAFSGNFLLRLVCSICTGGILAGLMAQCGFSSATADKKSHAEIHQSNILLTGFSGTMPYLLCWICLLFAKLQMIPHTFYRIYKLLCAPFMSICNLCSDDISALALPWYGIMLLGICSFLPMAAYCIAYVLTMHEKTIQHFMYKNHKT